MTIPNNTTDGLRPSDRTELAQQIFEFACARFGYLYNWKHQGIKTIQQWTTIADFILEREKQAASALQAQADALNRKTCEALNTQRAQEERIAELEAENTRLRKAIEEAPHNILCPIWVNGYKANLIEWEDDCGDKYVCNCWKSKALKEAK